MIDSMAFDNLAKQPSFTYADMLEILPGVLPRIIQQLAQNTGKPIIAGGLIRDKEDVMTMLRAGAVAISTTAENVWFM